MITDETKNRRFYCSDCAFVQDYLAHLRDKKNRSAMTLDSYAKDLSQFTDFLSDCQGGSAPVDQPIIALDSSTAQQFVDHLIRSRFSVSTVSRKVTAIRGFYNYLIGAGHLADNPFTRAYVPQPQTQHLDFLEPDQFDRLLSIIGTETWLGRRDRAMVALLYNTWMRVSELLALTPGDVDIESCSVTIHAAGRTCRHCPLQEWVAKAVRSYLDRRPFTGPLTTDCLFVNRDGGALTARSVRRKLKHYSRKAGLPIEVGPSNLRHSCAMHMLAEGGKIKDLRQQLGHLSASSMRPYLECLAHMQAPKEPAATDLIGI